MKKIILSSLITTVLLFSGTASGAVGGVALIGAGGVIAAGGSVAGGGSVAAMITGTVVSGIGGIVGITGAILTYDVQEYVVQRTEFEAVGIAAAIAIIVLDENRQVIEFKSIDPAHASDHGVTEAEIDIYNSELPIINLVVDEFSKLYGNEVMTPEEATAALKEVATAVGLSEECQVALSRIVNHQFKSS